MIHAHTSVKGLMLSYDQDVRLSPRSKKRLVGLLQDALLVMKDTA